MSTFSFDDVAAQFDVSTRTVEAWVDSGELTAVNVSRDKASKKRRLRITQTALNAFIAARSTVPASEQKQARRRQSRVAVPSYI